MIDIFCNARGGSWPKAEATTDARGGSFLGHSRRGAFTRRLRTGEPSSAIASEKNAYRLQYHSGWTAAQIARPGRQCHRRRACATPRTRSGASVLLVTCGEYIPARRMALKVGTTFNIQNL